MRDYEEGLLPAPFMLAEMKRFIDMKTEEGLKEARLIAVSIAPYFHPRLAAKQVSNIHEIGDKLDNLLREIDGKPGNTLSGAFGDPLWRLNNLYWITDKEGQRTQFQLNWAQEALLNELHEFNLILKARQLRLHDAHSAGDARRVPVQSATFERAPSRTGLMMRASSSATRSAIPTTICRKL